MILGSPIRAALAGLAAAAIAALVGCGGSNRVVSTRVPPTEYRIAAEDVLEVGVWKEPELSRTVLVRPDGNISLPLAGELRAEGRTARELEREIAGLIGNRIADPVVSVVVKEIRDAQVYVLGEVARPGSFPLERQMTVLHALALAGGLTEFADDDGIVVLRRARTGKGEHAIRLTFDYDDGVAGRALIELEPGDTVVVP
jgi:polysaccharide export outer membrane protein